MRHKEDLPDKEELIQDELKKAIQLEHPVQFTYFRRPGHGTIRTFSPYAVDDEMGSVIGWDHDKEELRNFTLKKCAWPVKDAAEEHEYVPPIERSN